MGLPWRATATDGGLGWTASTRDGTARSRETARKLLMDKVTKSTNITKLSTFVNMRTYDIGSFIQPRRRIETRRASMSSSVIWTSRLETVSGESSAAASKAVSLFSRFGDPLCVRTRSLPSFVPYTMP